MAFRPPKLPGAKQASKVTKVIDTVGGKIADTVKGVVGDSGTEALRKKVAAEKRNRIYVGGQVFKDRESAIKFMRQNPGWVGKRYKTIVGKQKRGKLLAEAGFELTSPNLQNQQVLRLAGKDIWTYGVPVKKKPATGPGRPGGGPAPTGGKPVTGSGRGGTGAGKGKGTAAPNGAASEADFYSRVAKLFAGLNPSVNQQIDPAEILGYLDEGDSTESAYEAEAALQQRALERRRADLERQGAWSTNAIKSWYGQVNQGVEQARGRNQESTQGLMDAELSNVQGILESVGGAAAQGAGPIGATGQAGVNTLAAIGAADSQFLADIQPLLTAEGANASVQEMRRLQEMQRETEMEMEMLGAQTRTAAQERKSGQGDKAAQLIMQLMQMNQAAGQQNFQNRAGLAETIAGLMLNSEKMTLAQQQAVMDMVAKQQALGYRAANDQANRDTRVGIAKAGIDTRVGIEGAKSYQKRIDNALKSLPPKVNPDGTPSQAMIDLQVDPSQYWASPKLMAFVKQQFEQQGLTLRDAQTRSRFVAAVEQYGVHVKPQWLKSNAS